MLITKEKAIQALTQGEIVAIPTETVYGLAARFDNENAVKQVFSVKERPYFDPLICHISNQDMLTQLVSHVPKLAKQLMDAYWPGPLTLVLPKHKNVNLLITSGLDTVAVRMPKHPVALEIIDGVGTPLCAPSANKFGKTSPTTGKHVEQEFNGQVAIVDAGECNIGIESTVARVTDTTIEILRPGRITESEMQLLLPDADIRIIKKDPASPGHVETHYQPEKPFYLVSKEKLAKFDKKNLHEWSLDENPILAARMLYTDMRTLSNATQGFYLVKDNNKNHGLWEAIWNRLEKASITKEYL